MSSRRLVSYTLDHAVVHDERGSSPLPPPPPQCLSRQLQNLDDGGQLGVGRRHHGVHISACQLGLFACGPDLSPLSQHLSHGCRRFDERESDFNTELDTDDTDTLFSSFFFILTQLGFILPLASQPDECYNEITPNDITSPICAASGTFLLLGGWAGVMWIFIRAVSLHLQICWQVTLGRPFMIISHLAGCELLLLLCFFLFFSGLCHCC